MGIHHWSVEEEHHGLNLNVLFVLSLVKNFISSCYIYDTGLLHRL